MYSQRLLFEWLSCAQALDRMKSRLLKSLARFSSKGFHSPWMAQEQNVLSKEQMELMLLLPGVICLRKEEEETRVLLKLLSVCNQYTLF